MNADHQTGIRNQDRFSKTAPIGGALKAKALNILPSLWLDHRFNSCRLAFPGDV